MKKKEEREQFHLAEELRREDVGEAKRKKILKKVRERIEKERTMKISVKEGSFASIMTGFGDYYITPYALALGANNFQIGLLKSFSGLLGPISQLYGSKLIEESSRKKIIIKYVSLQAFMWIPILLLSLLLWKGLLILAAPYLLIIFYTLYAVFGSIAGPAWFSLMGDIVPNNIRGRYFGNRNRITGSVALISTFIAAFLLDFFKTKGFVLLGFSILFLTASTGRFISASYFAKHYETRFRLSKKYYFSFFSFIKGFKRYNFTKFSFFVAIMYFAVFIASPFFTVYMLSELGFSYVTFMMITMSSSLVGLIMMPIWGKFSDIYGRREVLLFGTVLISITPILWLISASPYYLFVPMILSGIGWAGFGLSAFNFIYDSVSPQRRSLCVAYYNILVGIGIFIGSSLGGLILQYILTSGFIMNKFFVVFTISAVLRTLTGIIFLPKIKEVRKVKKFRPIISFRRLEQELEHEIADGIGKIKP